jgi:hypothetical protein
MSQRILSPEEGEELNRLSREHEASVLRTRGILARHGMTSPEFAEADRADGARYKRIRELQGMSGKHWMAS